MKAFFSFFTFLVFIQNSFSQKTETLTTGTSWPVPFGVTNYSVEAWGAGGGGQSQKPGVGGGGGAYGKAILSVTNYTTPRPSKAYSIGVGGSANVNGGSSTWTNLANNDKIVNGGFGNSSNNSVNSGGTASVDAFWTTKYSGGNGGLDDKTSSTKFGGGGGGPALDNTSGTNGGNANASEGLGQDGGANGGGLNPPINATLYGAGGGGSGNVPNGLGSSGSNGKIVLKYLSIDYSYYNSSNDLSTFTSEIFTIPASNSYFTENGTSKVKFFLKPPTNGGTIISGDILIQKDNINLDNITTSATIIPDVSGGFEVKIPASVLFISINSSHGIIVTITKNTFINKRKILFTPSALPVTLSSFTAKQTTDNKVSLAWVTSSESVNKGFSIERQEDVNGKFQSLGFIPSKAEGGNSQTTLSYNFKDVTAKMGTNIYRLVQEDLDGKKSNSEVRMVKFSAQSVSNVFPNPSTGAINISRSNDGRKMNIQVLDQSGRVISQVNNIIDNNYKINLLKSGIYNIKMTYPETGEQSIQRIVVQK